MFFMSQNAQHVRDAQSVERPICTQNQLQQMFSPLLEKDIIIISILLGIWKINTERPM